MKALLPQPDSRPHLDGDTWKYRLFERYIYEWTFWDKRTKKWKRRRIIIEEGFIYDGASVPPIFWTLLRLLPDGPQRPAALVHDVLYRFRGRLPYGMQEEWNEGLQQWVPMEDVVWERHQADKLFCRILRESGVSKFKRRTMYYGVRLGGRFSWPKQPRS